MNTFLNTTYYNSETVIVESETYDTTEINIFKGLKNVQKYLTKNDFYVGSPGGKSQKAWLVLENDDDDGIATDLTQEKAYTWNGYVGLVSVTEFMRASTDTTCTTIKNATNSKDEDNNYYTNAALKCKTNWIKPINNSMMTISPYISTYSDSIWTISQYGNLTSMSPYIKSRVFPVIYIKSDNKIVGTGSSIDPYTISR